VAEDAQGRPLGALILRVHERDGARVVGHRLAMAVEAAARRRGIGRQLLEHAKRYSRAVGADYLLLQVDPSNEPALQAYRVTGFQLGDTHGVVPMIVRFG
jgi:ribosomal protein S18 acetylase RimI-like enzyme